HHIEPSAKTCSSLIANTLIGQKYPMWAICGAFGDNLDEQAEQLVRSLGLTDSQQEKLKEIGELFNYNGYGSKIEDLHFHPAELYKAIKPYSNPLQFYGSTEIIDQLRKGYVDDMAQAMVQENCSSHSLHRIYMLPAASWARRVVGVFSNRKARERKDAAHAVIVKNDDGSMQVSVRAPLLAKKNADTLCRKFPTGGGRAAAAGINKLPPAMLEEFIDAFHNTY
nr:acetyltransferase [Desulfocapsaceae bacterium]